MQLSATHTTNTQLFSQFLPFFNIPELKFADLRLFWFLRISREFSRNFTSRSRSRGIFISLFILEKSEPDFQFTFHFSEKVKEIYLSLFTSRKEWTRFLFHFSLLGKSERDLFFTFTSRTFNTHSRRTLITTPSVSWYVSVKVSKTDINEKMVNTPRRPEMIFHYSSFPAFQFHSLSEWSHIF